MVFMRYRRYTSVCLMVLLCFVLCSCSERDNSKSDTKESKAPIEETTVQDIEIVDNSNESLIEVEKHLLKEDCVISDASFRGNNEVAAFLKKEDGTGFEVIIYDLFKNKITRKAEYECKEDSFFTSSKNLGFYVCDNKDIYVYDRTTHSYVVYDSKLEKKKAFTILKDIKKSVVLSDGSGILYIDEENKLYKHDVESESSLLIYAFDSDKNIKDYLGECSGADVYLFSYEGVGGTGYMIVDSEEHTLTDRGVLDYKLCCSGGGLVYLDYYKDKACVGLYSSERPRILELFRFEDEEELNDVRFYDDQNLALTVTKDGAKGLDFKIYDLKDGIFMEKLALNKSERYASLDTHISENSELVMILMKDNSGSVEMVYVWNLSMPTDAAEDNPLDIYR
ncbi:MAG TPA: hypothetical protein DEO82_06615 [Eubacterium sp.]|nr:hypothetical protein [Eubacterium sp.]